MLITQLVKTDSKRILSDSFMVFMYITPWVIAVLVKSIWPYLENTYLDVTFSDYALLTTLTVALLTPMNMGVVLGFQLLEEKEQGVFRAIAVTPLNNDFYLFYRFVLVGAIAMLMTLIVHEVLGLVQINLYLLLLVVFVASSQVPFQALLISSFAKNTLEGFAMMKSTGFLLLVPLLLTHFFPSDWFSWIAGIFPFFWVIKAYQFSHVSEIWAAIACLFVGFIYTTVVCYYLLKKYRINALK